MVPVDNDAQSGRELLIVQPFSTARQRNLESNPDTTRPGMVAPDTINLIPQVRSPRYLRLCCSFDIRRAILVLCSKYFSWTLSSSVAAVMTFCVATCLAMLIGIVVVCVTAAKQSSMCCCHAEIML